MNDLINMVIRGQHVMLDRDLANLYGVETKVLNQAVKEILKGFLIGLCSNYYHLNLTF